MLKPINEMKHFEPLEKITEALVQKTQSKMPKVFRIMVAYQLTKITSMMRININTLDRGKIPINMYALNLAPSGTGKGHSTYILEEHVINQFKDRFLNETFEQIARVNLMHLATQRTHKLNLKNPNEQVSEEDVFLKVEKEFESSGPLLFSFDSGTSAAVKQMRHKLLMADAGSVNFEMDEIGSNLLSNSEILPTFLELYDMGKIKTKLIKNTNDNKRSEEISGMTPTNLLWFGTPTKLLDGEKVEEEFITMLDSGYGRRLFFGYASEVKKDTELTPEEIFELLTDKSKSKYLQDISNKLARLANPVYFNQSLSIDKNVTLLLIKYKTYCEKLASKLKEHQEINKAELIHRYYKVLKLSGTFAFIDESSEITEDHLYSAIKLAEESGDAFNQILNREKSHVRLARYIANIGREVTQVDLIEDLPFYNVSESKKRTMISHAIAYGYKNNIIIKKRFENDIEFFSGETIEPIDLNKMIISFSKTVATNYKPKLLDFFQLHKLLTTAEYHWCNHQFKDQHRHSDNALPSFNMVVLDIDQGISIKTAKKLLKKYTFLIATTKSHTNKKHRFRIVLPLSHILKFNKEDYYLFMENVFNWLPFDTLDTQTKDIARKWETANGNYVYNKGELLDATLFIPRTKKEEEQQKTMLDHRSLTNIERWFCLNTWDGNRSNQLIKYALLLVDSGKSIETIRNRVFELNKKFKDKMPESEIETTILTSALKAVQKRDSKP